MSWKYPIIKLSYFSGSQKDPSCVSIETDFSSGDSESDDERWKIKDKMSNREKIYFLKLAITEIVNEIIRLNEK